MTVKCAIDIQQQKIQGENVWAVMVLTVMTIKWGLQEGALLTSKWLTVSFS